MEHKVPRLHKTTGFARRLASLGMTTWGDVITFGMTGVELALALLLILSCAGCARRAERAELPNLVVPVACASEIVLVGCDARVSPPRCKSARVTYRKGCEEIVVRK